MDNLPEERVMTVDERLNLLPADVAERLRKAFNKIIDEVEAMYKRGESDAAIAAHIDNWGRVFHGEPTV